MQLQGQPLCLKQVPGTLTARSIVVLWVQDRRPADMQMAQPNAPVSKTGHCILRDMIGKESGLVPAVPNPATHAPCEADRFQVLPLSLYGYLPLVVYAIKTPLECGPSPPMFGGGTAVRRWCCCAPCLGC
jgi:hypothetical protein